MFEKTLSTLPGPTPGTRIEIVQIGEPGEQPSLELRHLTDAGSLGWCVQKRITMAAGSVPALRDALNLMDDDAQRPAPAAERVPHLRLVAEDVEVIDEVG